MSEITITLLGNDKELHAIQAAIVMIEPLNPDERVRVVDYLRARFGEI